MSEESVLRVSDPKEFARQARAAGKLVVWVPRTVRSKETLLLLLSDALRFPRYFRRNWDALEECLNDLHWLPKDMRISIVHESLPFGDGENRATYLSILEAVAQSRADGRMIEVALPK
jgi:RNAse (barnase) inhibitor barstar